MFNRIVNIMGSIGWIILGIKCIVTGESLLLWLQITTAFLCSIVCLGNAIKEIE